MNRNKTVIVITDGHEQFAPTASLLLDEGIDVRFEKHVQESLVFGKGKAPDLIISELAVPNVDGLQLCQRVRADQNMATTQVLLVGDLSRQSSIVADGFRCGAADYVQKPINHLELANRCRDILESKNVIANRNITNRFDSLVENISDAITIVNSDDGTILFENPATTRVFGYDPDVLVGRCVFDLIHPADRSEVTEYFDSIHWGFGLSTAVEYRFRQPDGSWRLIESTGRISDQPDLGSVVIITSRESAAKKFSFENVMRNDTLRFALFDDAPTGLAIFSMSGHFVKGNAALVNMLDYSEAELADMALSEFIFSSDMQNDKRAIADVLTGKRSSYQLENGYLTPNGERTWGQLTIVRIDDEDIRTQFLIGLFEDPTKKSPSGPIAGEISATVACQNTEAKLTDVNNWKVDPALISKN